jgi:S1-C subfamily serine protease
VDGKEITSYDDIKSIVKAASVGDKLKFSVYREGKLTEVDVKCFEYVPESVDFSEDK